MISIIRTLALPVVAAGVIGAGALGLAGTAAAATQVTPGDHGSHSFSPEVKAHPAPNMTPGWHAHHGPARVAILQNR